MKYLFLLFLSILYFPSSNAQSIPSPKTGSFTTLDTVRINYIEFGSTKNPSLIFIHGGPGGNSKDFVSFAQSIQNSFHVVLYDQRGGGLSQRNLKKEKISLPKMVKDVKELQNHLHIKSAVIMGHSFGGTIAQEYALQYPDKVELLIILDGLLSAKMSLKATILASEKYATSENNSEILSIVEKYKKGDTLKLDDMLVLCHERRPYWFHLKDESIVANSDLLKKLGYTDQNINDATDVIKIFFDSGFMTSYSFFKKAHELEVPVVLIYGSNDGITTPEQAKKITPLIPNGKLITIPECGHFPYIEKPAELKKILVSLIKTK